MKNTINTVLDITRRIVDKMHLGYEEGGLKLEKLYELSDRIISQISHLIPMLDSSSELKELVEAFIEEEFSSKEGRDRIKGFFSNLFGAIYDLGIMEMSDNTNSEDNENDENLVDYAVKDLEFTKEVLENSLRAQELAEIFAKNSYFAGKYLIYYNGTICLKDTKEEAIRVAESTYSKNEGWCLMKIDENQVDIKQN